jgi:hypothetical protein
MAPTKKSTPAPAVVATPAPVSAAPVKAGKAQAAVESKAAPAKVVEVKAAPAKVVDTVVAPADAAVEGGAASALDDLAAKFTALSALFKETQSALKVLSKEYEKMKKTVSKSERKRANARTNPNGFAKPALITDALCDFLSVPKGTEMSRTDVTRKINAYIKEHNLNKPENKRIILPDEKLRKILNVKPSEEVSFFSLQRFLSPLFVKKTPVVAAA